MCSPSGPRSPVVDRGKDGAVFVKEMGIELGEFFRLLPRALESDDFEVVGDRIRMGDDTRHMEIVVTPGEPRRIALMTIPTTRVEIAFHGYTDAAVKDAMRRFDMHFQRGGG